jgi:hypothetical protein
MMEIIYRDSAILQLVVTEFNITLKDSYLFIPTKLSAFPSVFSFEGSKSYFPHLLPYDSNYIGEMPDKSYYDYNGMKSSERDAFIAWHEEKLLKGEQFVYLEDLEKYCIIDVDILRQGAMKFRDIFIEAGCTDPWSEAITLTHACSIVYRKCFMPPNTLALIPHLGYTAPKVYSSKGVKWLEYIASQESIHIRHARNDKELKLLNRYWVDGVSEVDGVQTVFEFVGVSISYLTYYSSLFVHSFLYNFLS